MSSGSSSGRRKLRWVVVLALIAFFSLALADSMGMFSDSPYTAIPHGDHAHYVPNDCEDFRINDFPVRAPAEDERITCEGRVVQVQE